MTLSEYFSESRNKVFNQAPVKVEHSGWLDFCSLSLKGGSFLAVDAQFVPSESDGVLVTLAPANYLVQAKAVNYGGDRRVSRLRVFRDGASPKLGGKIGETWTDTAKTGVCDFESFSQAWGSDDDASYEIIEPFFDTDNPFGIVIFDAARGAIMPFVDSGFGDGTFPVFELTENGKRVGFEIEFIGEGKAYPFGEAPFQRQAGINEIENRAAQGDVESQWQAGKMYEAGEGVVKDLEKAAQWFAKAAQNGKAEAATSLGLMYQNGSGVDKDYSRARELYETAAAKGLAAAINQLGVLYRHGFGVPVDLVKATSFYLEAAQRGCDVAQFNLGVHYKNGFGIEKNHEEAVKWFRLAAAQGQMEAICSLGYCYLNGLGVAKDEKEAAKLFLIGALRGHLPCSNNMGYCCETGCGVEKNLKEALIWYSVAARQGLPLAQMSLGILHKNGEGGVKRNLKLALKWLREAAKNGNAEAHYELGLLYENGEGVAANKVKACKFYQNAASSGFSKAKERLRALKPKLKNAK